ncbi:MAG: hypothetical protein ABI837_09565 [Acidobacteriota bacterium]
MTRKTKTKPELTAAVAEQDVPTVSVREFAAQLPPGHSLSGVAKAAKLSFTSLSTHVRHRSVPLSVKNTKKMAKWSRGPTAIPGMPKISAIKTLGIEDLE